MHRKLERILGYLFDHPVVAGKRANIKTAYTVTTYNYRIDLWDGGNRFPSLFISYTIKRTTAFQDHSIFRWRDHTTSHEYGHRPVSVRS